jgi:Zn-finger nucleic acid-binding protein
MADRSGVEIDYCPKCRGVWLDRGELDKIIDRSVAQTPAAAPAAPATPPPPQQQPAPHPQAYSQPRQGHYRDEDDGYYRKKRRESFLGDLFDF